MDIKPNMFRIEYYVDGFDKRTADIKELWEAGKYSNVTKVCPIYLHVFDPVDPDVVQDAINEKALAEEEERKSQRIKMLEKEIAELKGE